MLKVDQTNSPMKRDPNFADSPSAQNLMSTVVSISFPGILSDCLTVISRSHNLSLKACQYFVRFSILKIFDEQFDPKITWENAVCFILTKNQNKVRVKSKGIGTRL